ncbi:MAG TPA: MOSC domain-containing protein [Kofleriaceae bacterium]|nr:MOSC domain-containing protein [Kofleriaceae bacterium]
MRSLRDRLADVPQIGRVTWIGLRPAHDAPLALVDHVEAIADRGLAGDRAAKSRGGNRQVTLVQAEHLPVIASILGAPVEPVQLRRNLVIAGINLLSLGKLRFQIGDDVIVVGTGPCAPCSKLEDRLGPGGFQAARGHGGITAKIERGGVIRIGDPVRVVAAVTSPQLELIG